ncbi:MAG TPA: response regulator [Candidatus Acidoferrum sp.]|nr:response regulator [Candidatus Acidoferrum sp.]
MGTDILCVDDDPLMHNLLSNLLKQHGFQVSLATNGAEGLERARRRPPDLIVLDIMMPGMDGFEVCRQLRQDPRLRTIPVIVLTAMESSKLNEQAFAVGADVCMTKPFPPDRFISTVNMALQNAARQNKPKPDSSRDPAGDAKDSGIPGPRKDA